MQDYKRGSHTIWDCKYHLVWVTKYRYPILAGDVWVASSGNVTDDVWKKYIEDQKPEVPDDHFKVV